MPPLSNSSKSGAIALRRATTEELTDGLRLLLSGTNGRASDEQVIEFLAGSRARGVDIESMQVAVRGGRVVWALLPVISPGRTMLVLTPPHAPTRLSGNAAVVGPLMDRLCDEARRDKGVDLAQLLLDPAEVTLTKLYVDTGFVDLAELIYMQRPVKRLLPPPVIPDGVRIERYSPATHELFLRAIGGTYVDSLDCPGLNGLRDMSDVLEGHKHSGEFDPALWFALVDGPTPLGVMLLSRSVRPPNTSGGSIELVYLGLVPQARGRGLGDALVRLALLCVARENRTLLTLAVDSRNTPAIQLYQRHGLSRLGARRAMIRDLRTTPPAAPSPPS